LESTQVSGGLRIFCGERIDIANLNISGLDAWPFGARAEEPAAISDDARSVEGVAGDQKLHALTRAQIRTDYGALACSIFVQH
jgi:hypothetical protein